MIYIIISIDLKILRFLFPAITQIYRTASLRRSVAITSANASVIEESYGA